MASGAKRLVRRLLLGSRKLRVGLAVVVIVAALGVGVLQVVPLWDRKATIESAQTTTGTITGAEYGKNTYRISYEYAVDGESYESNRVFPGPYAPGGTASQQVLGQIPIYDPPESATVHYDPDNPDYAWLQTRESVVSRHVMYFFAGGAVAVLLLGYLYVEWKLPDVMGNGDPGEGPSGDGGQTVQELTSVMGGFEGDRPSEAEIERRMTEVLPEEAIQQAKTGGEIDPEKLRAYAESHSGGAGAGRPGETFGRIGRVLGLLKGAAVVVVVGGLVLVGVSVALGQILVP